MLHTGKENFGFQLDRARKKLPGSSLENIRQWIVDLARLTKANNVDNLVHGVSLSLRGSGRLDTRLDTPHSSNRHHPVSDLAQVKSGNKLTLVLVKKEVKGSGFLMTESAVA
jgi:hypothetical protein